MKRKKTKMKTTINVREEKLIILIKINKILLKAKDKKTKMKKMRPKILILMKIK